MSKVDDSSGRAKSWLIGAALVSLIAIELVLGLLVVSDALTDLAAAIVGVALGIFVLGGVTAGVARIDHVSMLSVIKLVVNEPVRAPATPPALRRWHLYGLSGLLLLGMYVPPYSHELWRRSVGVVSGIGLIALGLAEGRHWKGIGSLLGGPEAAGTVFLGAVGIIAWSTGLVG
jgi:hypothetical protein